MQHNVAKIGLRALSKSPPLKLGIILTIPTPGETSKWRSGGLQGMPRPDDHLLQSIGESKFLFNFFLSRISNQILWYQHVGLIIRNHYHLITGWINHFGCWSDHGFDRSCGFCPNIDIPWWRCSGQVIVLDTSSSRNSCSRISSRVVQNVDMYKLPASSTLERVAWSSSIPSSSSLTCECPPC